MRAEKRCCTFYHLWIKPVLQQNQIAASCENFLQKLERSSTYCDKICTCCAFYRPQVSVRQSCFAVPVWSEFRTILFNQKSVFTHLQQPDLLQERLRTRAVKRATSLCNSFLQQRCKTSCAFLLPVFSKFRDKIELINSKFELTDHETIARNLGKMNFYSV